MCIRCKLTFKDRVDEFDNKSVLEPEDDAATVNWGDSWCMPSKKQFDELEKYTTAVWTTLNGVEGNLFKGKNGGTIFMPASGDAGEKVIGAGVHGYYWTKSLDMSAPTMKYELLHPQGAHYFHFSQEEAYWYSSARCRGHSVRPVHKK